MKRFAALLIALGVHATTLAFAAAGIWVVYANNEYHFAWLLGGVLVAIGVALCPRPARLPADAETLAPSAAPELHAIAGDVAQTMGVRPPAVVAIRDLTLATTCERLGFGRVPTLVVGLPLWLVLTPRQRVALLAEAYAGAEAEDGLIVAAAKTTLAEWHHSLLDAEPPRHREEEEARIDGIVGYTGTHGTGYQVAGLLGRLFGKVLGWPVLLVEGALTWLTRTDGGRALEARRALALRAADDTDFAELDEVRARADYLAPVQSAVLRGESVAQIRQAALIRASSTMERQPPGLLSAPASAKIDEELLPHYRRAVRGFGLIS